MKSSLIILEKSFKKNFALSIEKIRGGLIGFIEDIAVIEEYRMRGIGNKIINELIKKGKNRGCYKLVLECREETNNFYKKIGFNESGLSMTMIL